MHIRNLYFIHMISPSQNNTQILFANSWMHTAKILAVAWVMGVHSIAFEAKHKCCSCLMVTLQVESNVSSVV